MTVDYEPGEGKEVVTGRLPVKRASFLTSICAGGEAPGWEPDADEAEFLEVRGSLHEFSSKSEGSIVLEAETSTIERPREKVN
jgi:hypothetical protein